MVCKICKFPNRFIYTDIVVIDDENINGILRVSDKYMVQTLKDKCCEFYTSSLDSDNACAVFQTAHDFHMQDMESSALNFIFTKGRACLEYDGFLHLSTDCLTIILESDKLTCDEETIYQRMVQWSNLRCEENSVSTIDENIRNCLGTLLYLIRFPCMEPTYFTEKVSSQKILTDEEKLGVYEHFHGKQTDIFISKHRQYHIRVERCEVDITQNWWYDSVSNACVDFQTSNNAELYSVLLFGSDDYAGSNEITITILQGSTVHRMKQTTVNSNTGQEIYEISLDYPVEIVAGKRYTIQLYMKGSTTFRGKNYTQKSTNRDGFVVTFFRSSLPSGDGTNETAGQIQGLVFIR